MQNYLIYDCEIVNCIPPKDGQLNPKYKYCGGWGDFQNMGISCIGFYASWRDSYHVERAPFEDFKECLSNFDLPVLVGFNSSQFDDNLCRSNGINCFTQYDILREIRIALYSSSDYRVVPSGFSYSLDALAKANGLEKTGNGALAPQWWQDGDYQRVEEYCLNDVKLTHEIFRLGISGFLRDPNTQDLILLPGL